MCFQEAATMYLIAADLGAREHSFIVDTRGI
ncbi:hypothetical protein N182_27420 [Sinorhizobium sp. GL2]|nr:hypothetical protein N182_27420 [Sinorhizobium sp. GL2]